MSNQHSHPHKHTHINEDGTTYEHEHIVDGHEHAHFHSPEEKKKQINRISRVVGHLEHVKVMIENDEDCSEVLNQLAANIAALNSLSKVIMNEHIEHCIYHAMEDGDTKALEDFQKSIQKFF